MIRQFSRFVSVGVMATLIHVAVAIFLERLSGLSPQTANFGGFLSALSFSYAGHLLFSFGVAPRHAVHGPRFALTALGSLIASSSMVFVIHDMLALPFAVAMISVGAIVPMLTFWIMRLWTFAEVTPASSEG